MQCKISNQAITQIPDTIGIWHQKCKRRPYLTNEVAAKRLAWCLAQKDWEVLDFMKYIFSDKCLTERRAGGATEQAWCQPAQKQSKEIVITYKKGKDILVIVQAVIWQKYKTAYKSELNIFNRDQKSKKHRYTAQSYITYLTINTLESGNLVWFLCRITP